LALDLANLASVEPTPAVARRVKATAGVNLLFVGRLAPNKRCEDLLKLVYAYRRAIGPDIHLWLVGNRSFGAYVQFLDGLVKRLAVRDEVTFTDRVSRSDLRAFYESCDLFVSASRHEGFGVPYIECMQFGLPILALARAATPETLGSSGVLVEEWRLPQVAEAVGLIASDRPLREQLIRGQRARLAELAVDTNELVLRQTLARLGAL
jgi:glycosyltransferase involved in cell wall biosynthesis